MTRDFLISFDNKSDLEDAVKKFDLINRLNQKTIFSYDKRKESLFVSLVIPEEINENYVLFINEETPILLKKHVVFVALKNGMHSSDGYVYSSWKNNITHIKDIFYEIDNFF